MKSKHLLPLAAVLCGWFTGAQPASAQGTAFTYQGKLDDGGAPANGTNYGMVFYLYDAPTNGTPLGNLGIASVAVSNGLFTVPLNFGNEFDGNPRWLEITVQKNGGVFTTLTPRQPLTATPYAVTAGNVTGALPAAQLSGAIANANLPASPTFSGTVVANSFSGNGGGLTNVNAATLDGLNSSNFWRTAGNAGTTPGPQFLGTTDNQPLEFKVNGQRVLRLAFYPNTYELGSPSPSLIGGHPDNEAVPEVSGATIAGGGGLNWWGATQPQRVSGHFGTIGGGIGNQVQGDVGVIAGGERGFLGPNAYNSSIGGGAWNTIHAGDATIGGGRFNVIQTNAYYSTIGGGLQNTIQAGASSSTIGGGSDNTIQANAQYATIPGGDLNSAASYAFAAGRQAKANHQGAFVWGDSTAADVASAANNSVTFRASGGYRLFSNPTATAGVSLAAGGTAWAVISDRNVKKDFAPVDSVGILEKLAALPITQWRYQWEEENSPPHIGPMAQDFKAAFYPGTDDKSITTQEADGVALAAIQGLNRKLEQKETEITELKQRLEKLEQMMNEKNREAK